VKANERFLCYIGTASELTDVARWANGDWFFATDIGGLYQRVEGAWVSAGAVASVSAKTDNYPLTLADDVVSLSVASKTLTLPTAVGAAGKRYTLKATQASGTITVATTSSQTIDGSTTQVLYSKDCMEVVSDGANWIIV
jgi:hypothetical protein